MDTSNDPRSIYLANAAAHMVGTAALAPKIAASPEVAMFLNEQNVTALQLLTDGKNLRCFAGQVAEPPPELKEVHFVKLKKEEI